jgi:3-hydroxybutyryl-CoA dehydrogenase
VIEKIGVIGSGTMGHGIAASFAMVGYSVKMYDTDEQRLKKAMADIQEELELLVEEDFISVEIAHSTLRKISTHTDLKTTVEDRDYVIEAIPELIALKQELFQKLDSLCPPHTILASNTSSLKLDEMMKNVSVERTQRMSVNHWYNPAHLMPIVELSAFGNMPDEIYAEMEQMYLKVGKQPVKVLKDIPGLIANRIQQGVAREVFSLIAMGAASPADIDKALKFGPAFRYATTGQLEVADFGGLDIWCTVGDNLLTVMDNSTQANELLRQKVAEGKLGLKSGEGFFRYPPEQIPAIKKQFAKKLIHQLKTSNYYK